MISIAILSARERQTLDLIALGYTQARAAKRMGISKATVDTYVERIRVSSGFARSCASATKRS